MLKEMIRERLWPLLVAANILVVEAFDPPACANALRPLELLVSTTKKDVACYVVYDHEATWRDAADFCQGKGGSLAQLTGKDEEKAFFMFMFMKASASCVWVGLSDPESKGKWRWQDGTLMDTSMFSSDHLGPPSSCANLCRYGSEFNGIYEISRQYCTAYLKFICQYDATGDDETRLGDETTNDDTTLRDEATTNDDTTLRVDTTLNDDATTADEGTYTTAASSSLRGENKRRDVTQRSSRFTKTHSESYILGQAVFRSNSFSVVMCARLCLNPGHNCAMFNYNTKTKECKGFMNNGQVGFEERENWDIWGIA